ncbi:chorismate--pyruvate lyase family protein [Halomonas sp. HNIBRBA4712]|uniref:chorismate--pyruvate lyase family protein n=1 Tax=Halomonas sp. HNIBRBA4712 TaxID=3373087 RepID=UPI003745B936
MASHPLTAHPYPRWRPVSALRPAMSAPWWQWVASTDSLTARLIDAGHPSDFRVTLLGQRVGVPARDEARALGLAPRRLAWLREVALGAKGRPWVVARSVAPLDALTGQHLDTLGERSLGSWLFRQPDLVRGPLYATAQPTAFAERQAPAGVQALWARRSVFYHGGLSLLVQEAFLSTMADDLGMASR